MAAVFACCSESLPSVAETSVRSTCVNGIGSAPYLSTSARSCASCVVDAGDLTAAGDAVRERRVRVVDLREGLDVAVEDDREVLGRLAELAALIQPPRHRLELVVAVAVEGQPDDRLAGRRVDVLALTPSAFRSLPVSSGTPSTLLFVEGWYLNR